MIFLATLVSPLLGLVIIALLSPTNPKLIKKTALVSTLITLYSPISLWVLYDKSSLCFQFIFYRKWLSFLNVDLVFAVDGISLFFIILTTFLTPICILAAWRNIFFHVKEFFILLPLLEFLSISIFSVLDLLLFYIFFESVLIPMFLIIGIWGSRERKIKASYFFFSYTLLGSLVLLAGITVILFETGTTNFFILLTHEFTLERQLVLWGMFFIAFAVKLPAIPFHIWLPEAHVEAPTVGSVILAGVLLKLGVYGLLRFSFILFPQANVYFTPIVYTIASISVLYSSLTTIRQTDLKRIIAYSSVAHMNFSLLGLFSNTVQGLMGGLALSISHGFVASGLFLCVGSLYDRHHTRLLGYYSGLSLVMPFFSTISSLSSSGNLGLPGTSSFVGELLVVMGSFSQNNVASILGTLSIFFGSLYSIWLYNRICFGNLKIQYNAVYVDFSKREFSTISPLVIMMLAVGFYPNIILDYLYVTSYHLLCFPTP
jgi:proton-translocating NADH-quinone oxidoreductase chain M